VKFQLPASPPVLSATLRARLVASSPEVPDARLYHEVRLVSDAWTEDTLTWYTQPGVLASPEVALGHAGIPQLGDLLWDVTELVRQEQAGDGVLSLRLALAQEGSAHSSHLHQWASRESGIGFRLDLVLGEPRIPTSDDLLLFGRDQQVPTLLRVVGYDPDTPWARPLASFHTVETLGALAVDPTDGSIVAHAWPSVEEGYPQRGPSLVRIDPATGAIEWITDGVAAGLPARTPSTSQPMDPSTSCATTSGGTHSRCSASSKTAEIHRS
jgi:hypothetical protein